MKDPVVTDKFVCHPEISSEQMKDADVLDKVFCLAEFKINSQLMTNARLFAKR